MPKILIVFPICSIRMNEWANEKKEYQICCIIKKSFINALGMQCSNKKKIVSFTWVQSMCTISMGIIINFVSCIDNCGQTYEKVGHLKCIESKCSNLNAITPANCLRVCLFVWSGGKTCQFARHTNKRNWLTVVIVSFQPIYKMTHHWTRFRN